MRRFVHMPRASAEPDSFTVKDLAAEMMPAWSGADPWLEWPPDLFLMTSIVLKKTGLYRRAVSNVDSKTHSTVDVQLLDRTVRSWYEWIYGKRKRLPAQMLAWKRAMFENDACRLHSSTGDSEPQEFVDALIYLHALADHACRGFGMMSTLRDPGRLGFLANMHLVLTGSLSTIPKRHGVVLPKSRTPQKGLSLRSFSHNLTYHYSEATVFWRTIPWVNREDHENTINIVAVPHPFEVDSSWFKPRHNPDSGAEAQHFRFFQYAPPSTGFRVERIVEILRAAKKEVKHVHVLVFPELALTTAELEELQKAIVVLYRAEAPARPSAPGAGKRDELSQIPLIVAGVRDEPAPGAPTRRTTRTASCSPPTSPTAGTTSGSTSTTGGSWTRRRSASTPWPAHSTCGSSSGRR
jgi:hypothetical protein